MPYSSAIRRATFTALSAVILSALASVMPVGAADAEAADASASSPVTWSVRPGTESGPDGRSWIEQELAPGARSEEHLVLRNFSTEPVTFALTAADGYFTDTGRFTMLPASEESVAAGTWISIAPSITVGPDETEIVPFTTTVPDNAEPGDHAAGVAASVTTTAADAGGAAVGVNGRVGFRVMTRVTGALAPSAEVTSVTAAYTTAWNPFSGGTVDAEVVLTNTGNTRLVIAGRIDIGGTSVAFPDSGAEAQELLPGESRRFAVRIADVVPLFLVPVDASADLTGIALDGEQVPSIVARGGTTMWAPPLPQLLLMAGAGLIVGGLTWSTIRNRRRVRALIAQAREEGVREAAASVTGDRSAS
ncbi:DUF916 domain-containing protein [Microbacterium proteolyticum]|uniref:DUF916 domain-containing protein n=1 Tax=Microbacterium proteolyticum TaxID=1572644 RepID=UPI001FAB8703|nr:DUF916 domain-containing protein [Microbacterium proteolyticum]MCI9857023.1 hypothetical protein [Microbacterium proteolyticum]